MSTNYKLRDKSGYLSLYKLTFNPAFTKTPYVIFFPLLVTHKNPETGGGALESTRNITIANHNCKGWGVEVFFVVVYASIFIKS